MGYPSKLKLPFASSVNGQKYLRRSARLCRAAVADGRSATVIPRECSSPRAGLSGTMRPPALGAGGAGRRLALAVAAATGRAGWARADAGARVGG